MSYTGNVPTQIAFISDQFSGTGSQTAFTMSVVPANTASMLVAISGILQNPSTYSIVSNTLTFSSAPAVGSGNISIRYLGIPASGVTNTAFKTVSEFTATAGQTVFIPPSYTVGFVDVFQNGAKLGQADYVATNGTTITLLIPAGLNDLISITSMYISSVLNAIPATVGAVTTNLLSDGATTLPKLDRTGVAGQVLTSQGIGNAPTWSATPSSFRNRIINGAMQIDQWHSGALITPTSSQYAIDRFQYSGSQASKFTTQQITGSIFAAQGFQTYLALTSTSAYSVLAGDYFNITQPIEAANISDFNWGTAAAQPVTLSFYVYSSLTGTFGGAVRNYALTRSYPFSYSIPVANMVTKITITIPGDTGGSWVMSGNGGSLYVVHSLGTGSTYSGTAGAWAGSVLASATGAVSVVGTSGATFYITGIQLEVGSIATPFERRLYGAELALCQRYYATRYVAYWFAYGASGNSLANTYFTPVTMRVTPTASTLAIGSLSNGTGGLATANDSNTFSVGMVITATGTAELNNYTYALNSEL